MMNNTGDFQIGSDDGPLSPLNYKRAVLRSAPSEFTVEVLPPAKIGGNYSYGIRVFPIMKDNVSLSTRSSNYIEYEIWRRWEDCLDFQITLETEYSRLSRDKVKHLKNRTLSQRKEESYGLYQMKQAAASFESLPEGPDPREVIRNVHRIIPELTRKGSVFRVSRETVEQRGREFAAMINGLFNPDPHAPVLLQELRNATSIRDFFGFWRRDHEQAEKIAKSLDPPTPSTKSMISVSTIRSESTGKSSLAGRLRHSFSVQLRNKSTDSTQPVAYAPSSAPPHGTRHSVRARSSSVNEQGPLVFTDEFLLQDRPGSAQSLRSSPGKATRRSAGFGSSHSPIHVRSPSSLALSRVDAPIPEEDMAAPSTPLVGIRPRSNSASLVGRRPMSPTGSIDTVKFHVPESLSQAPILDSSTNRNSMAILPSDAERYSVYSDIYEDDESLYERMIEDTSSFPVPPSHQHHVVRPPCTDVPKGIWRDSFSSIRTESSADGVLPRHLRQQFNIPLSDAPHNERILEEEDGFVESYSGYNNNDSGIRFSMNSLASALENRSLLGRDRHSGSSVGSTVSSRSTTFGEPSTQDTFAVKAIYKEHVILFRADSNMTLADIRERVNGRFAVQLSKPLKKDFRLGYMPLRPSDGLTKRDSTATTTDKMRLRRLQFDTDWESAMTYSNGKITLRVLDSEPHAFHTYI